MKLLQTILGLTIIFMFTQCSKEKLNEKGFPVRTSFDESDEKPDDGLNQDSILFETQPSSVVLTGIANVRLATIYKVNYSKNRKHSFIGSNNIHYNYILDDYYNSYTSENYMPGISALYGYNMVNISLFDLKGNVQKSFFEKPVLVKTLYYPSYKKDTLNKKPIVRNFFMVSVYNEDTNKDGFINLKDLRRFFLFNKEGQREIALVPLNYSVVKSEYDSENDLMYVFAQFDKNNNGAIEQAEPIHIFYVDLKNPNQTGKTY